MFRVRVQTLGDLTVFRCTGRFVYGSEGQLMAAFSKQRCFRVAVVDLAGVRMIGAAGLGSLVAVQKRARSMGINFRLMNLHPRIEKLLTLTNLRSVLEVCSVPEMLDLLCRAWNQPAEVRNKPMRTPLNMLDDGALFSVQAES
jgi:anti-anti-sigma factor